MFLPTSPDSGAKIHWGIRRSEKYVSAFLFLFGASFSSFSFILSTLFSDARDWYCVTVQLFGNLRKIHLTNMRCNWFEEMWPALKAHHNTPTSGGSSPNHILLGRDPLGEGRYLSGDGMAMDFQ